MFAMLCFSAFAYKWHYWQQQLDMNAAGLENDISELEIIPCLTTASRIVRWAGVVAMWPLRVCNAFVAQLRLYGQVLSY
jgi:hypothetical protein